MTLGHFKPMGPKLNSCSPEVGLLLPDFAFLPFRWLPGQQDLLSVILHPVSSASFYSCPGPLDSGHTHCSLNIPSIFLPQGLCTRHSLLLEYSLLRYPCLSQILPFFWVSGGCYPSIEAFLGSLHKVAALTSLPPPTCKPPYPA